MTTRARTPRAVPVRRLPRGPLLTVVAAAASTTLAHAGVKNWNVSNGFWATPANWTPFGAPAPADVIFIGNTAAAANGTVTLSADASAASIQITDGMTLTNGSHILTCSGLISLAGENVVRPYAYPSRLLVSHDDVGAAVSTNSLSIADSAMLHLDDGYLYVAGTLSVFETGRLDGRGYIVFTGDTTPVFKNDGRYQVSPGFSSMVQLGDGRIDLDGDVGPQSSLDLTSSSSMPEFTAAELRISGTGLADPMDDIIELGPGAELLMELDEGWTIGPAGAIYAYVYGDEHGPARVQGSHVTIDGGVGVNGADGGYLIFDAPSAWIEGAVSDIAPDCNLWLFSATLAGAYFALGEGSMLRFSSDTAVTGATFWTAGPAAADGLVYFSGATTYAGTIFTNGFVANGGDATVTGPTTITAGTFVPSYTGSHAWDIRSGLVLDVDSIGTSNATYAQLQINSTLQAKLTVQLTDPQAWWTSMGTANLGGLGQLLSTRIEGNGVRLLGDTTITNAVQITAPLKLSGAVQFQSDPSRLRATNATEVQASANFTGGGRLEVAASGSVLFDNGADLGLTDLVNESAMEVELGAGVASVDRLTLQPTSQWTVELGGHDAGSQYDQLFVNGTANTVAGTLEVKHLDLGDGPFDPQIGDLFTILVAPPNQLAGAFANGPVSHIPGKTFLWSIGYPTVEVADVVTLTLVNIVPCKADLNGDGVVEAADLAILLGDWGPNEGSLADFNADGIVAADDLAELLGAWGACVVN